MRLTDDVRALMQPNDPAPPATDELSERARFTVEDILVSRPGAVSTRTGVGPTPRRTSIGRGRRRRRWVIPLTVAIAASTGVAVALVFPEPQRAKHPESVFCYTDTDLKADPPHGIETMRAGEANAAVTAVAQCADLWRNGTLQPGARTGVPNPPPGPDHPVPPLVACVARDLPAVFPAGPDFCAVAGLPPLLAK